MIDGLLDQAFNTFRNELSAFLPTEARVIRVLSANQVMLDAGSAYGVRPGQKAVLAESGVVLEITAVNSGLDSVASGKPEDISSIRGGERVIIK
jgi:hypothetical protein